MGSESEKCEELESHDEDVAEQPRGTAKRAHVPDKTWLSEDLGCAEEG